MHFWFGKHTCCNQNWSTSSRCTGCITIWSDNSSKYLLFNLVYRIHTHARPLTVHVTAGGGCEVFWVKVLVSTQSNHLRGIVTKNPVYPKDSTQVSTVLYVGTHNVHALLVPNLHCTTVQPQWDKLSSILSTGLYIMYLLFYSVQHEFWTTFTSCPGTCTRGLASVWT